LRHGVSWLVAFTLLLPVFPSILVPILRTDAKLPEILMARKESKYVGKHVKSGKKTGKKKYFIFSNKNYTFKH
jgi:hypothetical protein